MNNSGVWPAPGSGVTARKVSYQCTWNCLCAIHTQGHKTDGFWTVCTWPEKSVWQRIVGTPNVSGSAQWNFDLNAEDQVPEALPLSAATIKHLYRGSWHPRVSATSLPRDIQTWSRRKGDNKCHLVVTPSWITGVLPSAHLAFIYVCLRDAYTPPLPSGPVLGFINIGWQGTLKAIPRRDLTSRSQCAFALLFLWHGCPCISLTTLCESVVCLVAHSCLLVMGPGSVKFLG